MERAGEPIETVWKVDWKGLESRLERSGDRSEKVWESDLKRIGRDLRPDRPGLGDGLEPTEPDWGIC